MSGIKQTTSRRVFSPEYKMHIVNEFTQGTLSVSVISRQFDINHNQIFRWVREARGGKAFWVTKAKQTTELVIAAVLLILMVSVLPLLWTDTIA